MSELFSSLVLTDEERLAAFLAENWTDVNTVNPMIQDLIGVSPHVTYGLEYLYAGTDMRHLVATPPSNTRQYPRTAARAIDEAMRIVLADETTTLTGSSIDKVAQMYGLPNAHMQLLRNPGPTYSSVRVFRWLQTEYKQWVVPSNSARSFGIEVPIGAVLYWDNGDAALSAGYYEGSEQVHCLGSLHGGPWLLQVAPAVGCLGWSAPIFPAASRVAPLPALPTNIEGILPT